MGRVKNRLKIRVKEMRLVKASEIQPHPLNWRTHPESQSAAMQAALSEIGFEGAVICRKLPDGKVATHADS